MFAIEQIKLSRLLTAHLEAFGANRVGRSGVKFDRLGKTTSGQPIFAVDEETANSIRATFIIDLALLRSYGRGENGLNESQKKLLLDLSLWKIKQLLARPFRYRTQCLLDCESVVVDTEPKLLKDSAAEKALPSVLDGINIGDSIKACGFDSSKATYVYYPADRLYDTGKEDVKAADTADDNESEENSDVEEV